MSSDPNSPNYDELLELNMLQLLVLAANVVKANSMPDLVGYEDWDVPFTRFCQRIEKQGTVMRRSEMEAALWACNLLDERGEFFNVTSEDLDVFINKLMNYKRRRKFFDTIYNQIRNRPRMGRPNKVGFDKVKPKPDQGAK